MGDIDKLLKNGITTLQAKQIIRELLDYGGDVNEILKRKDMSKMDINELVKIIDETLYNNTKAIAEYILGKKQALNFIVGQVLKKTKSQAEPADVHIIVKNVLDKKEFYTRYMRGEIE